VHNFDVFGGIGSGVLDSGFGRFAIDQGIEGGSVFAMAEDVGAKFFGSHIVKVWIHFTNSQFSS
jgi:hypothetical protein